MSRLLVVACTLALLLYCGNWQVSAFKSIELLPGYNASRPLTLASGNITLQTPPWNDLVNVVDVRISIKGIGYLLVNFLNLAGKPVDTLFQPIASPSFTTLIWQNPMNTEAIRGIVLIPLGCVLSFSSVQATPFVLTSFTPGRTYVYESMVNASGLALAESGSAAESRLREKASPNIQISNPLAPNTAPTGWGFGSFVNATFTIIGLDYTFEEGRMMVVVPPRLVVFNCTDNNPATTVQEDSIYQNCVSLSANVFHMPDVYITQDIITGEYVNFYVMNSNATLPPSPTEGWLGRRPKSSGFQASASVLDRKDLAVEAGELVVRLLDWDDGWSTDAQIVGNSQMGDSRSSPTMQHDSLTGLTYKRWSRRVWRHHVRRPVRRTYRHYNVTQSMSLFQARGYPLPSNSLRQGSNALEQGQLVQNAYLNGSVSQNWLSDMQCVEVLTENDVDPDFPLMDKTEVYNCTSVTCYKPGVGPIFTYLRQNGELLNTTNITTAAGQTIALVSHMLSDGLAGRDITINENMNVHAFLLDHLGTVRELRTSSTSNSTISSTKLSFHTKTKSSSQKSMRLVQIAPFWEENNTDQVGHVHQESVSNNELLVPAHTSRTLLVDAEGNILLLGDRTSDNPRDRFQLLVNGTSEFCTSRVYVRSYWSSLQRIWSEENAASNVNNEAFGPAPTHSSHALHAVAVDSSGSLHACLHHRVASHQEGHTNSSTYKLEGETESRITQMGMTCRFQHLLLSSESPSPFRHQRKHKPSATISASELKAIQFVFWTDHRLGQQQQDMTFGLLLHDGGRQVSTLTRSNRPSSGINSWVLSPALESSFTPLSHAADPAKVKLNMIWRLLSPTLFIATPITPALRQIVPRLTSVFYALADDFRLMVAAPLLSNHGKTYSHHWVEIADSVVAAEAYVVLEPDTLVHGWLTLDQAGALLCAETTRLRKTALESSEYDISDSIPGAQLWHNLSEALDLPVVRHLSVVMPAALTMSLNSTDPVLFWVVNPDSMFLLYRSSSCDYQVIKNVSLASVSESTVQDDTTSIGANEDVAPLGYFTHADSKVGLVSVTNSIPAQYKLPFDVMYDEQPMLVPVPSDYTAIDYSLFLLHTPEPAPFNFSVCAEWVALVSENPLNSTIRIEFQEALFAAGDPGVAVLSQVLLNFTVPAALAHDNATSAVLQPAVEMLPSSTFAPDLTFYIASNNTLPINVRIAAVQASYSLYCPSPSLAEWLLTTSQNVDDPSLIWDQGEYNISLAIEAQNALNMFADHNCSVSMMLLLGHDTLMIQKASTAAAFWSDQDYLRRMLHVPCPVETWSGSRTRQILHDILTSDATDSHRQSAVNGLAQMAHSEDLSVILHRLNDDSSPAVRTSAARGLRKSPLTVDVLRSLINSTLMDQHDVVRFSSLQSLNRLIYNTAQSNEQAELCHQQHLLVFTSQLMQRLNVNSSMGELTEGLVYMMNRVLCAGLDSGIALISGTQINQLAARRAASLGDPDDGSFQVLEPYGDGQSQVVFRSGASYGLSSGGFNAQMYLTLSGTLFDRYFDIVQGGIVAAWSSLGRVSVTTILTIFIIDPLLGEQYEIDVLSLQLFTYAPIGISSDDRCAVVAPLQLGSSISVSKTVSRLSVFYGFPFIADIDLTLTVIGTFRISYGLQILFDSVHPTFHDMGVKGYMVPALSLDGSVSANARVLVASGGVQGTLNVFTLSLPMTTLFNTRSFRLGWDMTMTATALRGRLDFYYSVFDCCWSWKPWEIDCSGTCSHSGVKNLFSWDGFAATLPGIIHREACDNYGSERDDVHMSREKLINSIARKDSHQFYDKHSYLPNSLQDSTTYQLDCNRFPEVCETMGCYLSYYRGGSNMEWPPADDVGPFYLARNNHDNLALGETTKSCGFGLSREEFPWSSLSVGGCDARIQCINGDDNKNHGRDWGDFLIAQGYKVVLKDPNNPKKDKIDWNGDQTMVDRPVFIKVLGGQQVTALSCCQKDWRLQTGVAPKFSVWPNQPDKKLPKNPWARTEGQCQTLKGEQGTQYRPGARPPGSDGFTTIFAVEFDTQCCRTEYTNCRPLPPSNLLNTGFEY